MIQKYGKLFLPLESHNKWGNCYVRMSLGASNVITSPEESNYPRSKGGYEDYKSHNVHVTAQVICALGDFRAPLAVDIGPAGKAPQAGRGDNISRYIW